MTPEDLRNARKQRGWRLHDVAVALGVTPATLSRWERGLQTASPDAARAWERAVTGRSDTPPQKKPRRRPRGVLARLAEIYLADVIGGLDGWSAGWRDMRELGLLPEDVQAMEADVERDELGRVRISHRSRLQPFQQARNILGYRRTVTVEEQQLVRAMQVQLDPFWTGLSSDAARAAIAISGLTEMLRTSVHVVERSRAALGSDPQHLVEALPVAGANVIARSVGLAEGSADHFAPLHGAGLGHLVVHNSSSSGLLQIEAVADELGLAQAALILGDGAVIALGSAWAADLCLQVTQVALVTEIGVRRFAEEFWEGLQRTLGTRRASIMTKWRELMLGFEPEDEKQQLGLLLWSWPEGV